MLRAVTADAGFLCDIPAVIGVAICEETSLTLRVPISFMRNLTGNWIWVDFLRV
jgi:hypothetical protein